MSPVLPILKPKKVLSVLLKAGFFIHHQTGSHAQIRHVSKSHLRVTLPIHNNFDLPRPVIKNILRQAEMTVGEFMSYL